MYIWDIKKLKESIKERKLSESHRFMYVLIYVVLSVIGIEIMAYMPTENANNWDYLNNLLNVLIPSIGTYFAYKSNGAEEGNDFLGKYFSIGFVNGIRFIPYLVPILAVYFIYCFYAYQAEEEISTSAIDVIPFAIWYIAMYWKLCTHIRQVKSDYN